jgi:FkbM family methyltransferase
VWREARVLQPSRLYWAKWLFLEGKVPTRRRLAKWKALWQFEHLVRTLGPDDVAIDCGANLGQYTHMLASTGSTVYAFEPDPFCFEKLTKAFGHVPNVKLFNQAVGVATGKTEFYRTIGFDSNPELLSLSSSVYRARIGADTLNAITVEQIDLVAFIAALPRRVEILKIDVEGAEVPILEKLLDTGVVDKVGYVFVDTHEKEIPELAARTMALRDRITAEQRDNMNLNWT